MYSRTTDSFIQQTRQVKILETSLGVPRQKREKATTKKCACVQRFWRKDLKESIKNNSITRK